MHRDIPHTAPCSRRDFLRDASRVSGFLVGCTACAATARTVGPDETAAEVTSTEVVIHLARAPQLATDDGVFVVFEAHVIVVRLAGPEYRAFSNVCTHAGCGITLFQAQRFVCQCHGSEYDTDGVNVAGPAPLPLTRLGLAHDAGAKQLRITRV